MTGNVACRPLSSGADQRLGTRPPGSAKPCRAEVVLHVMSFSVDEGVVGVIAILSVSITSFDLSCPATVSSAPLGESGAGLPVACFSISRSSCIVDVVMVTAALALLLLLLLALPLVVVLDFGLVRVLEKRLVVLKSPINHRGTFDRRASVRRLTIVAISNNHFRLGPFGNFLSSTRLTRAPLLVARRLSLSSRGPRASRPSRSADSSFLSGTISRDKLSIHNRTRKNTPETERPHRTVILFVACLPLCLSRFPATPFFRCSVSLVFGFPPPIPLHLLFSRLDLFFLRGPQHARVARFLLLRRLLNLLSSETLL